MVVGGAGRGQRAAWERRAEGRGQAEGRRADGGVGRDGQSAEGSTPPEVAVGSNATAPHSLISLASGRKLCAEKMASESMRSCFTFLRSRLNAIRWMSRGKTK